MRNSLFFSGSYVQTHSYDDGQNVDLGGLNAGDIISFDLNARTHAVFGPSLSETDVDANDLYSPAFDGREFRKYDDDEYDAFVIDQDNMNGVAWGPKESPSNSTCKIRAYYHDISHNGGLVTLMYDFTGFLVGDSLLMTAAHGLYRDVTVGDYDDGIDNKYIPGKVEVYGAIGMADTWGPSYAYYAKGTKVFFPSSYATYRSFADDWALLRLDTPLGRELSYRKLSITPMDLSGDYRIIGYPSFNQFHIRMDISATDYVVDSTRPMNNPNLTISCHSYDEVCDYESVVEPNQGVYEVSTSGLRSIDINYEDATSGQIIYMDCASFDIDWNFNRINYSAPYYDQDANPSGNCVSYAIEGIERLNSGSVLPKRANGTTLNRLTDYYPGMLIAGLTKALESEGIRMEPIGKYELCQPGSYKIAVICDPYRYYHVLRENSTDTWSHFLIGEGVKKWDSDYASIGWPDEARMLHQYGNGDHTETYFDLTSFLGYFSIRSIAND